MSLMFRRRVPGLGPLDAESIHRWLAIPDHELPGPALTRTERDRLAALLYVMWTSLARPSPYDESESIAIEWRPDFEPAPSYEWGAVESPHDPGCLLEWTRPVWEAEQEFGLALDDFDYHSDDLLLGIESRPEHTVVFYEWTTARIEAHCITLHFDDYDGDDPTVFARAIVGLTGWAAAAQPGGYDDEELPRYLAFENVYCRSCHAEIETGIYFDGHCPDCSGQALSTSRPPRLRLV